MALRTIDVLRTIILAQVVSVAVIFHLLLWDTSSDCMTTIDLTLVKDGINMVHSPPVFLYIHTVSNLVQFFKILG